MTKEPLLFETIKIEDGQILNIFWHNQRCNRARYRLFNVKKAINLERYIQPPPKGVYRCRVVYNREIISIEYIPYKIKTIRSFKIIKSQLEYSYKYNNRDEINRLLYNKSDDIIIEKDGFLTDTSIANIAFYTGEVWITPKKPLLEGTTRARLINSNFLITENIKSKELQKFSHFALMNAMIGFQIQKSINIEP